MEEIDVNKMEVEEFDVNNMEVDGDSNVTSETTNIPNRKVDLSEIELKEYFKQINEKVKQLNIKGGAKEFTFEDGFSCIARDEKNANRKHQNWILKIK